MYNFSNLILENIDEKIYDDIYNYSINHPEDFWKNQLDILSWIKIPTKIKNTSFENKVQIKWFEDGVLNACYNCIDRHLETKSNDIAINWEGDDENEQRSFTYSQLHDEVSRLSNVLKKYGVKKGDRVIIYLPMIPEAIFSMLACARIGAVHSVVFSGLSSESLKKRIQDSNPSILITSNESVRGGKNFPLKKNLDDAVIGTDNIKKVIVVKRTNTQISWNNDLDVWYEDEIKSVSNYCEIEPMNSEDPLFILYTSGSTGTPKGVVHTTGGYLLYSTFTFKILFNYKENDVFWCSADIGWVTGHSYLVYGPLSNGANILTHEGTPFYPDSTRHMKIIDKYNVNIYYTAPTVIRSLMKQGNKCVKSSSLNSLKILGSVGEPLNVEAWKWYNEIIGKNRCPIIDTWWQTETGGIMISPMPNFKSFKPGAVAKPFFGISPVIKDYQNNELVGEGEGMLCIKDSWPGQSRTLYNNHNKFVDTYFSEFKGNYFSGDKCKRDTNGDYIMLGRGDDVINISGHCLNSGELESAINSYNLVCESAVVGYFHEIKGEGICAFIILKENINLDDSLKNGILEHVKLKIGSIAKPTKIFFVDSLPKTRSGKIMRRILRDILNKKEDNLGDLSTLANPDSINSLVKLIKDDK